MSMLLIFAIAAIGGAVFFFAELATSPMRTRRNLVHRAANYGRLRTVTGKAMPRFRQRALDPLSVTFEAGLGFDCAVQKLTEHMEGPLIEEFELALGEIRIGEGRQEALKKMSERSASPEMASFVRAIIQADQLGISLGRILRVQAGDTRLKRQLLAEEKAMKAPIKMLFPTVA